MARLLVLCCLAGCFGSSMPTAAPQTGHVGAFAQAVPADGDAPPDARAGEVPPSPSSWPPSPDFADCTDGHDELRDLEQSFGMTSVACPSLQYAPVTAVSTGPVTRHKGFNAYCYPLGGALLIVETTEMLGSCKHIVGLGLYPRQP